MLDLKTSVALSPVIPIPPAYLPEGGLDTQRIIAYLKFLESRGAQVIMTTAGTSQYNLLTYQEVIDLNKLCGKHFAGRVIMGLQPLNTRLAMAQADRLCVEFTGSEKHAVMPVYPDRYHDDESIVDYFHTIARSSSLPVFIHGMFMRNGRGGTYNYTAGLINKIAAHPNIIGMKEETTDYAAAYSALKNVDENFVKIVAGGSMRRYMLLSNAGKNITFLSGIGSLYPELENKFLMCMQSAQDTGDLYPQAQHILKHYEDPFFDVFMSLGWHRALRGALQSPGMPYNGSSDRKPFSSIRPSVETDLISIVLKDVESKIKDDKIVGPFKEIK